VIPYGGNPRVGEARYPHEKICHIFLRHSPEFDTLSLAAVGATGSLRRAAGEPQESHLGPPMTRHSRETTRASQRAHSKPISLPRSQHNASLVCVVLPGISTLLCRQYLVDEGAAVELGIAPYNIENPSDEERADTSVHDI